MQTDAVERALEKVLTSTAFSRTQRLRRFLEYVVLEVARRPGRPAQGVRNRRRRVRARP